MLSSFTGICVIIAFVKQLDRLLSGPVIGIKASMQASFPETSGATPWLLIKAFPDLDGTSVYDNLRFIRVVNNIDYGPIEIDPGELHLSKSANDPLYEIPVHDVRAATYLT
ncbi:MAG: hypothetical protein ACFFDU_09225 [Candidatus Thorarchaeota archaeon]